MRSFEPRLRHAVAASGSARSHTLPPAPAKEANATNAREQKQGRCRKRDGIRNVARLVPDIKEREISRIGIHEHGPCAFPVFQQERIIATKTLIGLLDAKHNADKASEVGVHPL